MIMCCRFFTGGKRIKLVLDPPSPRKLLMGGDASSNYDEVLDMRKVEIDVHRDNMRIQKITMDRQMGRRLDRFPFEAFNLVRVAA